MLYPVKQPDHFLGNWHSHFSVLPHTTLIRDCFLTGLLASFICSQPFCRLNFSPCNPSHLSPTILNIRWRIKPKTCSYGPSITDASKPKKQIYQNVWLQYIGQPCDSCHEPLMMGAEAATDMDTKFIFAWLISWECVVVFANLQSLRSWNNIVVYPKTWPFFRTSLGAIVIFYVCKTVFTRMQDDINLRRSPWK